ERLMMTGHFEPQLARARREHEVLQRAHLRLPPEPADAVIRQTTEPAGDIGALLSLFVGGLPERLVGNLVDQACAKHGRRVALGEAECDKLRAGPARVLEVLAQAKLPHLDFEQISAPIAIPRVDAVAVNDRGLRRAQAGVNLRQLRLEPWRRLARQAG